MAMRSLFHLASKLKAQAFSPFQGHLAAKIKADAFSPFLVAVKLKTPPDAAQDAPTCASLGRQMPDSFSSVRPDVECFTTPAWKGDVRSQILAGQSDPLKTTALKIEEVMKKYDTTDEVLDMNLEQTEDHPELLLQHEESMAIELRQANTAVQELRSCVIAGYNLTLLRIEEMRGMLQELSDEVKEMHLQQAEDREELLQTHLELLLQNQGRMAIERRHANVAERTLAELQKLNQKKRNTRKQTYGKQKQAQTQRRKQKQKQQKKQDKQKEEQKQKSSAPDFIDV
ncbi:hypothetical protein T484DRAFT_1817406 [Baffinella frigidus]|nr:hypothetical protein T484DRAFT_1817406 [Cryptophyta sp. CCMP2293]